MLFDINTETSQDATPFDGLDYNVLQDRQFSRCLQKLTMQAAIALVSLLIRLSWPLSN